MNKYSYLVPMALFVAACGADETSTRNNRSHFDSNSKFRFLEIFPSEQGVGVSTTDAQPSLGGEPLPEGGEPLPEGGEPLPEGGEPLPPAEEEPKDDDETNGNLKDRASCAELLGLPVEKIRLAGNINKLDISRDDALMIKVTGNQNKIVVKFTNSDSEAPLTVPGICVFLAGNKSEAHITVGSNVILKKFSHIGRGNQSKAVTSVENQGAIESITGSLHGNQQRFTISGPGSYVCPALSIKGNGSKVECK